MGIRHLYSHLLPYARPETFLSTAASKTALYIDGPALCHHIYHLLFISLTASGNAFETTLSYHVFALAFASYLSRLESSGFAIKKILFDSALPASKSPTRLSRLDDSLRKLKTYRSANATLRSGSPAEIRAPESFFSSDRVFAARTQHLAAPPFIVAAALSLLSRHEVYSSVTETVPGEADPFLAASAIAGGGVVLTGDSDLLVFGDEVEGWGVVMLQDLSFNSAGVTARVFRPAEIRQILKYPLLEVAWQTGVDTGYASLSQILERLARIKARRKQGAGGEKVPKAFKKEYSLPTLQEEAGGRLVAEPRIGELLFLAKQGSGERKMYLPFLNEDPQRAPAWEVGAEIRAAAYGLLFSEGEVVEVFRRGTRITEAPVLCQIAEEKLAQLSRAVRENPDSWWAAAVLDSLCTVALERNQPGPSRAHLTAAAASLFPNRGTVPIRQKWSWELVHLFASVQAGWYSLLLMREVLEFLAAQGSVVDAEAETLRMGLQQLPDILDLFDGNVFLGAFEKEPQQAAEVGKAALARYCAAVRMRQEEEAEAVEEEQDAIEEQVNGNGKRPSEVEEDKLEAWSMALGSKAAQKRKRKKDAAAAAEAAGAEETPMVDKANKFALLAGNW